jgi:hypothetical protein
VVWLGGEASLRIRRKRLRGRWTSLGELSFYNKKTSWTMQLPEAQAQWLAQLLPQLTPDYTSPYTFRKMEEDFAANGLGSFKSFFKSETWEQLRAQGLLVM